jgi:hypothetical protein
MAHIDLSVTRVASEEAPGNGQGQRCPSLVPLQAIRAAHTTPQHRRATEAGRHNRGHVIGRGRQVEEEPCGIVLSS